MNLRNMEAAVQPTLSRKRLYEFDPKDCYKNRTINMRHRNIKSLMEKKSLGKNDF